MTTNDLKRFLNDRKYNKDRHDTYTHTIISGYGYGPGSYYVAPDERHLLYKLLNKAIFEENGSICLTEKPTENSPLRIDVDFRYKSNKTIREYTRNDIMAIVGTYNSNLIKYLDIDEMALVSYIMEREEPYVDQKNGKNVVKDGIHIFYPNIVLSKKQHSTIRKLILPNLAKQLSTILEKNDLSIDNVIDNNIIDVNWFLYGCTKPNVKPYLLTRVYDYQCQNLINSVDTNPGDLINLLKVNLTDNEQAETIKPDYEPIYNIIETKNCKKNITNITSNNINISQNPIDAIDRNRNNSDIDLKDVKNLISCLSTERATNYDSWIRVGWCLKNIHTDLLESWIEFSKQSDKFNEGVCENEWDKTTLRNDGFGLGSLYMWAKSDNPEKYAHLMSLKIDTFIKRAADSCSHQDVGTVVHELYQQRYSSTDGAKKTEKIWYEFKEHKWQECDGKLKLQRIMGTDIQNQCRQTKLRINQLSCATEDDELKQRLDKQDTNINKLITKLKEATFKEKVIKECTYMFHDETFYDKLDENIELIGCKNGVYNLKTKEFREGRPTDYISFSTPTNYQTSDEYGEYSDSHPYIKEVNDFFKQILPIEGVRNYLKLLLGGCLYGRNINEHFYILEGVGGNGKSKLIEFIEITLGQYAASMSSNYFTQKKVASHTANPDIAKIVHARIVTSQETEENEKFNISILKGIVGNDKLTYRPMYGACREVRPKFNMLMAVNHLPRLPPDDEGTWRRIRLIRFISRFTDNPDPTNPYEFKKDLELDKKFARWKEAFQFLLFEWHFEFRSLSGKIPEPEEVVEATKAYQKQNDQYSDFLTQYVIYKENSFLSIDSLYNLLKDWWTENSNTQRPDKRNFRLIIERRWGKATLGHGQGTGWHNRELCLASEERTADNQIVYIDTEIEI